jgi:hypothetical protein
MNSLAATVTNSAPAGTTKTPKLRVLYFQQVTALEAQSLDRLAQTERQRMTPGLPDPSGRYFLTVKPAVVWNR